MPNQKYNKIWKRHKHVYSVVSSLKSLLTSITKSTVILFFVDKIEGLKEKIDQNLTRDPLEKIKEKVKNKNLSFN